MESREERAVLRTAGGQLRTYREDRRDAVRTVNNKGFGKRTEGTPTEDQWDIDNKTYIRPP